jgi:hypothetical protein
LPGVNHVERTKLLTNQTLKDASTGCCTYRSKTACKLSTALGALLGCCALTPAPLFPATSTCRIKKRTSRGGSEYGREGGSEPERTHTEREMSRPNWTGAARKEKPRAVGLHAAGRNLAAQFPGDGELDPRDRFPERREGADLVFRTEPRGAVLLAHWSPTPVPTTAASALLGALELAPTSISDAGRHDRSARL